MPGVPVGMSLMRDFYQEIIDIIGSGGEACCVIPIGDSGFENAAHTTVTSKGQGALDGVTVTYNPSARTAFDNPTEYIRNRFQLPLQDLNGVDEDADTPDLDAWSRDDASGEGLSFGALLQIKDTSATRRFFDRGNGSEWHMIVLGTEKITSRFRDPSAGVTVRRDSDLAMPVNQLTLIATTYDGSGGASAMDGAVNYENGLVVASTATNNASYEAMENTVNLTRVGSQNGTLSFFAGKIALPFWTGRTLNAVEMFNLNDIYVAMQRAQRSSLLAGVI